MNADPLQLPETGGIERFARVAGAAASRQELQASYREDVRFWRDAVRTGRDRARRFWRPIAIAAFLAGLVGGILFDHVVLAAASRPGQDLAVGSWARDDAPNPGRTETPSVSIPSSRPVAGARVPGSFTPASATSPGPRFGIASWYDAGVGLYAALPGPWRAGRHVLVCGPDRSCLSIRVVTSCRCPGGRIVDLSADAFRYFAPLSAGLVRVSVEVLD